MVNKILYAVMAVLVLLLECSFIEEKKNSSNLDNCLTMNTTFQQSKDNLVSAWNRLYGKIENGYSIHPNEYENVCMLFRSLNAKKNEVDYLIDNIKNDIVKNVDVNNDNKLDFSTDNLYDKKIVSKVWQKGMLYDKYKSFISDVKSELEKNGVFRYLTDEQKAFFQTELASEGWENLIFKDKTAIECLAMLSKTQNDILNMTLSAGELVAGQVDDYDFRISAVRPVVVPKSNVVALGQDYEADIYLVGFDTTKMLEITVNGRKLDSKAITLPCNQLGKQTYNGQVTIQEKNGRKITYDFQNDYVVVP